jgi:predicted N-acetyltransferase YhbS
MTAFREAVGKAKTEWFDNNYGEKQIYLGMLACHPDYQKRGAGEMLVRWGIDKGRAEGLTPTLFASPMGMKLYTRLGYKDVGSFRAQVEREKEYLDTPGMVLELESR